MRLSRSYSADSSLSDKELTFIQILTKHTNASSRMNIFMSLSATLSPQSE